MFGQHNVLNTVASMIVALNIGIDIEDIKSSLKSFKGVKRRYTNLGIVENITFIDDYAHHPSEIEAVINATGQVLGGQDAMVVIVQPHRYTRLRDQFDNFCKCFNKAHFVIILDVYSAGEQEIEGFNSMELANGIKNRGHKNVMYLKDSSQIAQTIANLQTNSPNHISMAIFMGAGSITSIASDTFKNFPKKNI
jgi:UDP-N-acetylmuramate--alanine ligase